MVCFFPCSGNLFFRWREFQNDRLILYHVPWLSCDQQQLMCVLVLLGFSVKCSLFLSWSLRFVFPMLKSSKCQQLALRNIFRQPALCVIFQIKLRRRNTKSLSLCKWLRKRWTSKWIFFGAETTLLFEKNKNRNKYVLFTGFAAEDHDD